MAGVPSSDLVGHKQLHDRVSAALDRCREDQDIDFKESAAWSDLQYRIVHAALGMANLRDGGVIIIGVSERDSSWMRTGIDPAHRDTFDVDDVAAKLNSYVSPHVDVELVLVQHETLEYLAVHIREFRETPVVCKKNGPDKSSIVEGAVYVRPPGMARTTKVVRGEQMHDLLELAAEKRARALLEKAGRIGMKPDFTDAAKFDAELGDL
jgi:predicted HTH transcriptional regulator